MKMQGGRSISIRNTTRADVPAVVHCLVEAFEEYRDSYSPGAFADTVLNADALERRMETMCVLVAVTLSGQVVGTIAYQFVKPGVGPYSRNGGAAAGARPRSCQAIAGRCRIEAAGQGVLTDHARYHSASQPGNSFL